MHTATISVPFAATQRAQVMPSRPLATQAPSLNATNSIGLRRSLMTFARDTLEALHGIAAYCFVFVLMYWMGAFVYAVL